MARVLRRGLGLACLMLLFAGLPRPGVIKDADPWYYLEKGFALLDVENISYRGYLFFPDSPTDREALSRLPGLADGYNAPGLSPGPPEGRWWFSSGVQQGYQVIWISGTKPSACRLIRDGLQAASGGRVWASSWGVEAFIADRPGDLTLLGMELLAILGGRLRGTADYNGAVHFLADAPWAGEPVSLAEGPVNLNLELYRDPVAGRIRIRAGVPVILTLAPFSESLPSP
jgi:hypothetical protein